jgi:hypothetical protein
MSLVVVCVVHVSQYPLLFLSFVVMLICDLFIYSCFTRAVRQSVGRPTSTTIFFVHLRRALAVATREGDFFKVCF